MPKTIREIITDYLQANGFDGFYCPDKCHGCNIDELLACGEQTCDNGPLEECIPGYEVPCDCMDDDCNGFYHIVATKNH